MSAFFAVAALADAPDATNSTNYSNLGFAPNQASVVGISYDPTGNGGTGTTTLTVEGGWAWATHGTDCNTDRAGAGYAMSWNDPNDAGYPLGSTGISVGSQNPNGFAANTDGNVVQPTPSANDPSNPLAVHTVTSPSDYANWGGGCGEVSTGTVTGWQGSGSPPTSFSQGYWGPISHTYVGAPSDLPSEVCAVTYDVHKGTAAADGTDGLGTPGSAKEITAGGSGYNGDNGVEDNGKTPAGNQCAQIVLAHVDITKTADAVQVSAGEQIGFTVTVSNSGTGDAQGVTLSDPLPTNAGLDWQIESQGSGWAANPCAITSGTLSCGPATVPAGTTQGTSTFTVHITSLTTAATGGTCPAGSGEVDNTGTVDSTNAGTEQSTASTCVQGLTDLQITKTGSPKVQNVSPFKNITWTLVVTNNGPLADTNVMVADPMPAGNTYVSSSTAVGSCTGGAVLNCSLGTLQAGDSVEIVLVTKPKVTGKQINTATVAGDLPETTLANNTASAHVLVNGPGTPPAVCTAVIVRPNQLYVGRSTRVRMKVTSGKRAVAGVRVRIKGPGLNLITSKSGKRGRITKRIDPQKAGVMLFKPVASRACKVPRVGVASINIPVTG